MHQVAKAQSTVARRKNAAEEPIAAGSVAGCCGYLH